MNSGGCNYDGRFRTITLLFMGVWQEDTGVVSVIIFDLVILCSL